MKRILAVIALASFVAGCQTQKSYYSSDLDTLPNDLEETVRNQIGDAEILGITPSSLAGDAGYYQIDYISGGEHHSVKFSQTAPVMSRSEAGMEIEEAAGSSVVW